MRIFLVHWNAHEGERLKETIEGMGHVVTLHSEAGSKPILPEPLPEFMIVSLERLPSHGRAIADWWWNAKSRRDLPLLFLGGDEQAISTTRVKFPEADYAEVADLVEAVERTVLGECES